MVEKQIKKKSDVLDQEKVAGDGIHKKPKNKVSLDEIDSLLDGT